MSALRALRAYQLLDPLRNYSLSPYRAGTNRSYQTRSSFLRVTFRLTLTLFFFLISVMTWGQVELEQTSPENQPLLAPQEKLDIATGKALFERLWVPAPASTTGTDGLGPLFNARSCSECHPNAGRGSSITALTLHIQDPVLGRQIQTKAILGSQPEALMNIHFSSSEATSFDIKHIQQAQKNLPNPQDLPSLKGSLRLAPDLSTSAVLARMTNAELAAQADPQDLNQDGVSGRLAFLSDSHDKENSPVNGKGSVEGSEIIGRFGWKAEFSSLEEQIAEAFSTDLGLATPLRPQPWGDCTEAQLECRQLATSTVTGSSQHELVEVIPTLIERYLLSLAPKPISEGDPGMQLFEAVGCSSCHSNGATTGVFSDFLLHDMGAALADTSEILVRSDAKPEEWRTPSLRGLSSLINRQDGEFARKNTSGLILEAQGSILGQTQSNNRAYWRLLHDGRATTIEDAILAHGGEAETARERYVNLSHKNREILRDFLHRL
jgi:CxxC motif-containing protein (DUF1111 family)